MKGRDDCALEVHPSTVAVALDRASIVLELLGQLATDRGDQAGHDAWLIAKDALERARECFREARSVQSNRRNATGGGYAKDSDEACLRALLGWLHDDLDQAVAAHDTSDPRHPSHGGQHTNGPCCPFGSLGPGAVREMRRHRDRIAEVLEMDQRRPEPTRVPGAGVSRTG